MTNILCYISNLMLNVSRLLNQFYYNDFDSAVDNAQNTFKVVAIIFGGIFVGVLVLSIVLISKGRKTTKDIVDKVKTKIVEKQEYEKAKNLCEYCGAKLAETDQNCPNCGANRKK
ncbi:MAG: hypothetical protein IKB42_02265 [Clostridia bacterium]|nr:hypothetical protein [Clostridia bacterium]